MTTANDQNDVNEILMNIQNERGVHSQAQIINLHAEVADEEIMAELDDGEKDKGEPDVEIPSTVKAKPEDQPKPNTAKKDETVIVVNKKGKGGLKTVVMGAFGLLIISCAIGFYVVLNNPSQISGVSLPSLHNWSLLGSTKAEDPVVKSSVLNERFNQLRIDIANTVNGLAKSEQVAALQNELNTLSVAYSQQSSKINSLQDTVAKFSEQENISTSSAEFISLKSEIDVLNGLTGDLFSKLERVETNAKKLGEVSKLANELKNSNWTNHLRLEKLEKSNTLSNAQPNSAIKSKESTAETITWENKHNWKLKIASDKFTQIIDTTTKRPLRIYKGVNVPSCGLVLDIDVTGRKVTTQHCVISR